MLYTSRFFCPRSSFTCWWKPDIFLGIRLTNLMLCLAIILLMWLETVQMQRRNMTADEYSRAESSPYISVEVLIEMKKFCIWSYSFNTLQSSRWLGMFQMDQQALSSSKTHHQSPTRIHGVIT